MQGKRLILILWPSFIVAGAALAVFFTVFDPQDLRFFGEPLELSRMAIYSLGFFLLWVFAAASSALTCFFQRTSAQINREEGGGRREEGGGRREAGGGRREA